MLLGPIVGADVEEWERMLAINVADVVNISSIAGRQAWKDFGVYNLTKFGVNGFTESLRQEVTRQHVRVGVLEPGAVETELESHNNDQVKTQIFEPLRFSIAFRSQHKATLADRRAVPFKTAIAAALV